MAKQMYSMCLKCPTKKILSRVKSQFLNALTEIIMLHSRVKSFQKSIWSISYTAFMSPFSKPLFGSANKHKDYGLLWFHLWGPTVFSQVETWSEQ